MAEFKGTKGNWKIGNNFSNVVTDEKTERASYSEENYMSELKYYGGYLICESVSKKADAKLIAAAPEMLKALDRINNIIYENSISVGSEEYFEIRSLCNDLIKKATE